MLRKIDAKMHDEPVQPKNKRKGKGEGKGKAKAKGRGKKDGKAVRHGGRKRTLLGSLLDRARKSCKTAPAEPALDETAGTAEEPAELSQPSTLPPAAEPSQPSRLPPAPEPSQPSEPAGAAAARAPVQRVHKSPEDILKKITPPGAFIGLSFGDHRFVSKFASESPVLEGTKFAQKTMSASFVNLRSWQDALALVHKFNWEKWGLVRHDDGHSLPDGVQAQVPGSVSDDVLAALAPIIASLPPVKGRSA